MVSLVSLNYLMENTLLSLDLQHNSAQFKNLLKLYREDRATFQFTIHFGEIYLGVISKENFSDRYYIKFHFGVSAIRERMVIFDYRIILHKFLLGNLVITEEDFINLSQIYSAGEVLQARNDLSEVNIPADKDFMFDWQISSEGFVSIEGISRPYFLKLSIVTLNLLIIAWRRMDAEKHKAKAEKL